MNARGSLAAVALFAAVVAAQDQPRPTFRTEANYVRVDVYPTRDDAPVTDLTQADFEILDNGVPQKVEQFERVVIRAAGPQETRVEPNTVRESRAMLESSRARVFVLFLDIGHVGFGGSNNIRKPLVNALDKVIGADDLVGLMTPDMSARDVGFGRKTTTIDGILDRYSYWGERDRVIPVDPQEQRYLDCYPFNEAIAREMIARRREKQTLDALEDAVRFLGSLREERKALLVISEGWLLYRPNAALDKPLDGRGPTGPSVGVDPRSGKLALGSPRDGTSGTSNTCDSDRTQLSYIDDDTQFHRLIEEANRANTSFYPIDPRGLVVFDTDIGPAAPPPINVDADMLRTRLTSLKTLGDGTDGFAIINSNDIARGLQRVVADLTSYYLLGYYSSEKLDGKFHSITVRVKRPGVRVRARRGYLAASANDVNEAARAAAATATAPSPAVAAEARALEVAIAPLEGYMRQLPVRVHGAAGWKPGNAPAIWVVGEVSTGPEWKGGGDAELSLTNGSGTTLASSRARIEAGARGFRAAFSPAEPLAPGDYQIRVRVKGSDALASASETLRIALPQAPAAAGAVFVRRGPATGNRDVATSDLRFRRGDQLRVEIPTPENAAVAARLLDRTGKPFNVPVAASVRDDPDGSRWQVAQLSLAPLAPSDYVIELSADGTRTLIGFRVIP